MPPPTLRYSIIASERKYLKKSKNGSMLCPLHTQITTYDFNTKCFIYCILITFALSAPSGVGCQHNTVLEALEAY